MLTPDEIRSRLKLLFVAMYRDNEGERSNAAAAFYRFLVQNNIHPKEVDLLVGLDLIERNKQVIEYFENEVKRLAAENAFLRRHVSPDVLRQAASGLADLTRWFALYDGITDLFDDPLPADWRHQVAKRVGVPPSMIKRWEAGLEQVPDDALERLRTSYVPDEPVAKPRQTRPRPTTNSRAPKRKTVNPNQLQALQGVRDMPGCTIRNLSFHLFDEPDINENLADVVSVLYHRKWVTRKAIDPATRTIELRKSRWRYYITPAGSEVLNENMRD